jgi:hypothetical protein
MIDRDPLAKSRPEHSPAIDPIATPIGRLQVAKRQSVAGSSADIQKVNMRVALIRA